MAAEVGPALGLNRRLPHKVPAAGESAEELIVEVVAVGEHDDGRVRHRRLADDAPGIEGHGQALARALGVPDDADAPIAWRAARPAAGFVMAGFFVSTSGLLQLGRPQRLGNGGPHGVELVIARHLLGERAAAVILERDEVADQREEPARFADAFEHHLELRQVRIGQALARDRAPGLEPLPPRGERADPRLRTVGDHKGRIHGEQRRQLGPVGLELSARRSRSSRPRLAGLLSSISPSGSPFTNSTTSGRRSCLFSTTVNWLTASQSLPAGSSKSMTRAWAAADRAVIKPRYSTVTPSTTSSR